MKRVLLLPIAILLGGVIAAIAVRRLPAERREDLSQLPGAMMGWMVGHMPDE
jgi:hypothetical protein